MYLGILYWYGGGVVVVGRGYLLALWDFFGFFIELFELECCFVFGFIMIFIGGIVKDFDFCKVGG